MANPTKQFVDFILQGGTRGLLVSSQTSGLIADAFATSTQNLSVQIGSSSPSGAAGEALITDGTGAMTYQSVASVALAGAVILAPGSSTRNVIQPTGNYNNLVLKGYAGQTEEYLIAMDSLGEETFNLRPYSLTLKSNTNYPAAQLLFINHVGTGDGATMSTSSGKTLQLTSSTGVTLTATSDTGTTAIFVGDPIAGVRTNPVVRIQPSRTGGGTIISSSYPLEIGVTGGTLFSYLTGPGGATFNENGRSDADVRIEGDTDTNLFFTNSATDRVGIGTNAPNTKFQVIGDARVGDLATNYTNWDTTGYQTMVGTAKPWDDIRIEPTARSTGVNVPSFEKWYDDAGGTSRGVYLYSFDDAIAASEKELFFTMQMPHSWDGGDIHLHVHWIGAVDDTTAAPRWGLEYAWKKVGSVFGDTTIVYSDGVNYTSGGGTVTDITANTHYISAFSALTPGSTADSISSILIGRIFRNSSDAADTYDATGAKCGMLYCDAHFQLSSIGSNDEYTK